MPRTSARSHLNLPLCLNEPIVFTWQINELFKEALIDAKAHLFFFARRPFSLPRPAYMVSALGTPPTSVDH